MNVTGGYARGMCMLNVPDSMEVPFSKVAGSMGALVAGVTRSTKQASELMRDSLNTNQEQNSM